MAAAQIAPNGQPYQTALIRSGLGWFMGVPFGHAAFTVGMIPAVCLVLVPLNGCRRNTRRREIGHGGGITILSTFGLAATMAYCWFHGWQTFFNQEFYLPAFLRMALASGVASAFAAVVFATKSD